MSEQRVTMAALVLSEDGSWEGPSVPAQTQVVGLDWRFRSDHDLTIPAEVLPGDVYVLIRSEGDLLAVFPVDFKWNRGADVMLHWRGF